MSLRLSCLVLFLSDPETRGPPKSSEGSNRACVVSLAEHEMSPTHFDTALHNNDDNKNIDECHLIARMTDWYS